MSKLTFKQAAAIAAGVPVPEHWLRPDAVATAFLVKRERGAFGDGMRGPFKLKT